MGVHAEKLIDAMRVRNRSLLPSELFLILTSLIRLLDDPKKNNISDQELSLAFVAAIFQTISLSFLIKKYSLLEMLVPMITLIIGTCFSGMDVVLPKRALNFLFALPKNIKERDEALIPEIEAILWSRLHRKLSEASDDSNADPCRAGLAYRK